MNVRCRAAVAAGVLAGAIGVAGVARAQTASAWQAEIGVGRESLDKGLPDWRQDDVALRWRPAPRRLVEFNARRTERFGLSDHAWGATLTQPLDEMWGLSLEAETSPTHRVLPRSMLAAGVQRSVGEGWVLAATARATRYDVDHAWALVLGAERYVGSAEFGEWRLAGAVTSTRLSGVGTSSAVRVQLDRYFGEGARLGLVVSVGKEVDNLGQGNIVVSAVESAALVGRWPLGTRWALVGELGHTRLGALYRRGGGRAGVQLDF